MWDPNVNLMNFGDISYLPYMALVYPFWLARVDIREALAWIGVGAGLLIFVLGTIAWFYGKAQKRKTIDFWIYRYSRHPQYLGFIIWSYGVMLFAAQQLVPMGGSNPGASLPWLITSLVVIWIALSEESRMRREDSERYSQYTASAPFMFPIPRFVSAVVTLPMRLLLQKSRPETGKELLASFAVYATLLVLLSSPFVLLDWPPGIGWSDWPGLVPAIPGPMLSI
jgi:protein-S-isoprenylcysteine O-methyltransferase Ste14